MAQYVILGNFTDQGIRDIKGLPQRVQAVRQRLEAMGGKFVQFYLTMGQYDYVLVAEAPSDEVMSRQLLAVGSMGNSRTTTLKAFGEQEMARIIASLP